MRIVVALHCISYKYCLCSQRTFVYLTGTLKFDFLNCAIFKTMAKCYEEDLKIIYPIHNREQLFRAVWLSSARCSTAKSRTTNASRVVFQMHVVVTSDGLKFRHPSTS